MNCFFEMIGSTVIVISLFGPLFSHAFAISKHEEATITLLGKPGFQRSNRRDCDCGRVCAARPYQGRRSAARYPSVSETSLCRSPPPNRRPSHRGGRRGGGVLAAHLACARCG